MPVLKISNTPIYLNPAELRYSRKPWLMCQNPACGRNTWRKTNEGGPAYCTDRCKQDAHNSRQRASRDHALG